MGRCSEPWDHAQRRAVGRHTPSQHVPSKPRYCSSLLQNAGRGTLSRRQGHRHTGDEDAGCDRVKATATAAAAAARLHLAPLCDAAALPGHRSPRGAAAQRHVGHPQRAACLREDERLEAKTVVKAVVLASAELHVEVGEEDGGIPAGGGEELLRCDHETLPRFVAGGWTARRWACATPLHWRLLFGHVAFTVQAGQHCAAHTVMLLYVELLNTAACMLLGMCLLRTKETGHDLKGRLGTVLLDLLAETHQAVLNNLYCALLIQVVLGSGWRRVLVRRSR